MEQTILRSTVYESIQSGEGFDAIVVSCDRRRGTGGKLMKLEGWMIMRREVDSEPLAVGSKDGQRPTNKISSTTKDPNHGEHGTLNVYNPANAGIHPISIHLDLIQFFNGKRVIN